MQPSKKPVGYLLVILTLAWPIFSLIYILESVDYEFDGIFLSILASMIIFCSILAILKWIVEQNQTKWKILIALVPIITIILISMSVFFFSEYEFHFRDFMFLINLYFLFVFLPIYIFHFLLKKTVFGYLKYYYKIISWWERIKEVENKPFVINLKKRSIANNSINLFVYNLIEIYILYMLIMPITITIFPDFSDIGYHLFANLFTTALLIPPFSILLACKILRIGRNDKELSPAKFHKLWSVTLLFLILRIFLNLEFPSIKNLLEFSLFIFMLLYGISLGLTIKGRDILKDGLEKAYQEKSKKYLVIAK